jgi:hypothetical protein
MKHLTSAKSLLVGALCLISFLCNLPFSLAGPVTLQQATATFSQTLDGDYSVAKAINGTTADDRGWAISPTPYSTLIPSQTAAFETATDIGYAGASLLTFTLIQNHSNPQHTLGRFRLSVTTDDRSLFCDGLPTGGDVTANWTVLNPSNFISANGTTLSKLADSSLLASGTSPAFDTYTVTAQTTLTGITGIRLEAIEDPSLPFGGPGRWPGNGNFVLSELQVDIAVIPEPSAGAMLLFGSLLIAGVLRSRNERH